MKAENVHVLIDLCEEGGRLRQYFPRLEKGLSPREIRVAEQLWKLSQKQEKVRVSDISEMLEVTRPGITASLNTLTEYGYTEKERDTDDGRVVYVHLTERGKMLVRHTVTDFHQTLADTIFSEFDDEEVLRLSEIVHRAVEAAKAMAENQSSSKR